MCWTTRMNGTDWTWCDNSSSINWCCDLWSLFCCGYLIKIGNKSGCQLRIKMFSDFLSVRCCSWRTWKCLIVTNLIFTKKLNVSIEHDNIKNYQGLITIIRRNMQIFSCYAVHRHWPWAFSFQREGLRILPMSLCSWIIKLSIKTRVDDQLIVNHRQSHSLIAIDNDIMNELHEIIDGGSDNNST